LSQGEDGKKEALWGKTLRLGRTKKEFGFGMVENWGALETDKSYRGGEGYEPKKKELLTPSK